MLSSPSRCVRALAGLASAAVLSGCFRYVPVELGAVPPDSEVRVHVSRRGLADIPEEIPTGSTYVNGRFVRETADSVLVQVALGRRLDQPGALDLRQNVLLPRSEIEEVELR